MKRLLGSVLFGVSLPSMASVVAEPSSLDGLDFSPLTGAVSFGAVIGAVLAVAVILCGVRLVVVGAKFVMSIVKGA